MGLLTEAQVIALSKTIDPADFDRDELAFEVEDVYPELNSFQIEQVVSHLLGEDPKDRINNMLVGAFDSSQEAVNALRP